MEHADRILTGVLPSLYYVDLLVGAGIAAVVKILVWQKQADAKKLRRSGVWFSQVGNSGRHQTIYGR